MPSDGPARGHSQRSLKWECVCREGAQPCWLCLSLQRNNQQTTVEERKREVSLSCLFVRWNRKMKIGSSWHLGGDGLRFRFRLRFLGLILRRMRESWSRKRMEKADRTVIEEMEGRSRSRRLRGDQPWSLQRFLRRKKARKKRRKMRTRQSWRGGQVLIGEKGLRR